MNGEATDASSWGVAASPLVGKLAAKRTEGVLAGRRATKAPQRTRRVHCSGLWACRAL